MKITIDTNVGELAGLTDQLGASIARHLAPLFSNLTQEIDIMSGTMQDQLTAAQAAAEAALNDISAKVDAAIAAAPADGTQISQENVDTAVRIAALAQAISSRMVAPSPAPVPTPAPTP